MLDLEFCNDCDELWCDGLNIIFNKINGGFGLFWVPYLFLVIMSLSRISHI